MKSFGDMGSIERMCIAGAANLVARRSGRTGAPTMYATSSRLRAVAWLQWADSAGNHVDGLALLAGQPAYTLDRAWQALADMARGRVSLTLLRGLDATS